MSRPLWYPLRSSVVSIAVLLVIFGPSLVPRLLALVARRRSTSSAPIPPSPAPPRAPLPLYTTALLALHTVYLLLQLIHPPYDIFTSSGLPLFAPNSLVRGAFLGRTAPRAPQPIDELLLSRLQNYDSRLNYARFGHAPLVECVWCETPRDYALYALPSSLIPYLAEGVLLGLLSLRIFGGAAAPLRAAQWRGALGWAISLCCVAELLLRFFWDLRPVNGDCTQLSSRLHVLRTVARLVLPLIYVLLPLAPPKPHLAALVPVLVQAQNSLRLLGLTRSSVKRDARLRRTSAAVGEEQARQVALARSDPDVHEAIAASGLDEGAIRQGAGKWVREGWQSLIRVEE